MFHNLPNTSWPACLGTNESRGPSCWLQLVCSCDWLPGIWCTFVRDQLLGNLCFWLNLIRLFPTCQKVWICTLGKVKYQSIHLCVGLHIYSLTLFWAELLLNVSYLILQYLIWVLDTKPGAGRTCCRPVCQSLTNTNPIFQDEIIIADLKEWVLLQ